MQVGYAVYNEQKTIFGTPYHHHYATLAWEASAAQVTESYSNRLPARERFYDWTNKQTDKQR